MVALAVRLVSDNIRKKKKTEVKFGKDVGSSATVKSSVQPAPEK